MTGCDGQTDGQGRGPLDTGGIVVISSGTEHHQDQHHRDHELDAEGLAGGDDGLIEPGAAQAGVTSDGVRDEDFENTSSENCSQTLCHNVQKTLD